MSHRWELTWQGSGFKTGTDVIEAPTLNEALTIWQIDENQRCESPDEDGRRISWPRRIIKVRWTSWPTEPAGERRPICPHCGVEVALSLLDHLDNCEER